MEIIQGVITTKTENGKGIKIDGGAEYYNAFKAEMIAHVVKGDTVRVTYTVKEPFRNIKTVEKLASAAPVEAPAVTAPAPAKPWKPETKAEVPVPEVKKASGTGYGSPEDVKGKQRGCALNAATALLSGKLEFIKDSKELATAIPELVEMVKWVAGEFENFLKS